MIFAEQVSFLMPEQQARHCLTNFLRKLLCRNPQLPVLLILPLIVAYYTCDQTFLTILLLFVRQLWQISDEYTSKQRLKRKSLFAIFWK